MRQNGHLGCVEMISKGKIYVITLFGMVLGGGGGRGGAPIKFLIVLRVLIGTNAFFLYIVRRA